MSRFHPAAHLRSAWQALAGSYWFVPSLMSLGAGALALCVVALDGHTAFSWAEDLPGIRVADAEGSRSVVSVIAGSIITVTGVVFSVTVVALTLASSQFGPRMLRNFMRSRGNQLVLGALISTFLFNLLVLRAITDDFVPELAVTGAVALGVASLFVLIYFIHHIATSIQASEVIDAVAREIEASLPTIFPEDVGEPLHEASWSPPLEATRPVEAPRSGYVRVIDSAGLLETACRCAGVVIVAARPGGFVRRGAPLAHFTTSPTNSLTNSLTNERQVDASDPCDEIRSCFAIGAQRTAVQDLAFLTDQLKDIAVRALSPGVNDPATAIACIERLGEVVGALAARRFPHAVRLDAEGEPRVVAQPPSFEELAEGMLGPIRHHGAADPSVATALLRVVGAALPDAFPSRRAFLLRFARELKGMAIAAARCRADRDQLEAAFDQLALLGLGRVSRSVAT